MKQLQVLSAFFFLVLSVCGASIEVQGDDAFDPYSILNLKKDATPKQLENSCFILARRFHPSRSGKQETIRQFLEVMKACGLLGYGIQRPDVYNFSISHDYAQLKKSIEEDVFYFVNGVSGFEVKELKKNFRIDSVTKQANGYCHWSGTAPVCKGRCEGEEKTIRSQDAANCTDDGTCKTAADSVFGKNCWSGHKSWCCLGDTDRRISWAGRWISEDTGSIMYCKYETTDEKGKELECGAVKCHYAGKNFYSLIGGDQTKCKEVNLFGRAGSVIMGKMVFNDYDVFYKISELDGVH